MKGINSKLNIQSFPIKLTEETASEMIKNIDCVVDCVDNIDTRFLMNKYCSMNNIPLVSGSLFGWEGQITVYNYENGPCYECIVPPNIQRNYNSIIIITYYYSNTCNVTYSWNFWFSFSNIIYLFIYFKIGYRNN